MASNDTVEIINNLIASMIDGNVSTSATSNVPMIPTVSTATTAAPATVPPATFGSSMADGVQILNIFTWVTKIFTLFSSVISVPFYIIVIYAVIKRRKKSPFNSKYFTIYSALGFVDIMCYLYYIIKKCPYWNVDIPLFQPYDQHNYYMQVLYFLIWWFAFAQYQLTILISINRFASIVFSSWYQRNWTTRFTIVSITVIFVECACLAIPIFNTKVTVATTFMNFADGIITKHSGPIFGDANYGYYYNLAWKGHIYSIIGICCIFYPIMFWRIKTLKQAKNSKMRSEIKLMYSALVLFFANLLYAAYFVFRDQMIAQYKEFGKYSEWTLFLLADVYDLHNSYALVLTSKEVRKAVWRTITFSNEDSVMLITGFSNVPRQKDGSTNFITAKTDSTVGVNNNIVLPA